MERTITHKIILGRSGCYKMTVTVADMPGLDHNHNMTVEKSTNLVTTVLALLNAQFGGSIMVLPLLALQVGWLPLVVIVLLTVLANWYSCHLILLHLGQQHDAGAVISNHFQKSPLLVLVYHLASAGGLLTACMVYFKLAVIQVEELFLDGQHYAANPILNGVLLLAWLFATKCWDIDTHISGYGFFSIAAYFLFLLWAFLSSPPGPASLPSLGSDFTSFTAVMSNALVIQFIFVPILKSYRDRDKYQAIMLAAYALTMLFYYYINGLGALSVANRTPRASVETIESYFPTGEWPVILIQTIYLIHLYSVFPQFVLTAKKRVFVILGREEPGPRTIDPIEITFFVLVLLIATAFSVKNINIKYLITFNATVFCTVFAYFIPALLHLKCAYFSRGKTPPHQLTEQSSHSPVDTYKQSHADLGEELPQGRVHEGATHFRMSEYSCGFKGEWGWGLVLVDLAALVLTLGLATFVVFFQAQSVLA